MHQNHDGSFGIAGGIFDPSMQLRFAGGDIDPLVVQGGVGHGGGRDEKVGGIIGRFIAQAADAAPALFLATVFFRGVILGHRQMDAIGHQKNAGGK